LKIQEEFKLGKGRQGIEGPRQKKIQAKRMKSQKLDGLIFLKQLESD
jgi:hypothetical protein